MSCYRYLGWYDYEMEMRQLTVTSSKTKNREPFFLFTDEKERFFYPITFHINLPEHIFG
jgi:hypothetical protein